MLFCSIDHKVPGRPQGALRAELGLVGLPSMAFLDPDGAVLVQVPHDARTVDGLRAAGARATRYVELRASAPKDVHAAAAFLRMQFEERQLTLEEGAARWANLRERCGAQEAELDAQLAAHLEARLLDLRIQARLAATRAGQPAGGIDMAAYRAAGKDFLQRLREGPHPTPYVSRGYWYAMLEYAESASDAAAFREVLDAFTAALAVTAPDATWVPPLLERYRATLRALEGE